MSLALIVLLTRALSHVRAARVNRRGLLRPSQDDELESSVQTLSVDNQMRVSGLRMLN